MPNGALPSAAAFAQLVLAVVLACVPQAMSGCRSMSPSAEACRECGSATCSNGGPDDCNMHSLLPPSEWYVRCIDERVAIHDAIQRANEAMRYDYNAPPSDDVRYGYQEAYIDIALGASGEVPPVPPPRYWGAGSRTAEGHARAQDWFAGYAVGATRALASCRQQFNTVPASGRTQFATGAAPSTVQEPTEGPAGWTSGW